MADFCKSEECPSSDELLAFQLGEISLVDGGFIRRHLTHCDFCVAEVEFYENYPPAGEQDETVQAGTIPTPLYELAEALLTKKNDDRFFDQLVSVDDLPSR